MSISTGDRMELHVPQRTGITPRRLAIWLSLGLICITALAALLLMQGIDRQLRDVADSHAVRNAARELSFSLTQAEASQRGFLLTRDPQFLETYVQSVKGIDARLDALVRLTEKDPERYAKVSGIAGSILAKLGEMERIVAMVNNGRDRAAQSLAANGMGAWLTSDVSETLERFVSEEDQELIGRNDAIDDSRMGLVIALLSALAAAAVLAYALLTRTQRQVRALSLQRRGLQSLNQALEAEVAARTRDIEEARTHAERERQRVEALLQETNHRIGNSLATVSSLLVLQMMQSRSTEVQTALEAARLRVHAVASSHRRLRLGSDLETANAQDFLSAVIDDIAETQIRDQGVALHGDVEAIEVSARDATTLGILVGELVTNALKHAFPDGRTGTIAVRLFLNQMGVPTLVVSDNGVGMANSGTGGGLGSAIIRQLATQFGGEPVYSASADGGLEVTIVLTGLYRPDALRGAR